MGTFSINIYNAESDYSSYASWDYEIDYGYRSSTGESYGVPLNVYKNGSRYKTFRIRYPMSRFCGDYCKIEVSLSPDCRSYYYVYDSSDGTVTDLDDYKYISGVYSYDQAVELAAESAVGKCFR